ncbi:MAG: class I SAM-dependent methyltransferase [Pyrinomonadaceae bacterium]|nr:class I SAM-dependent methyltransferase [Pyrinomonadaceae bacterium]
MKISRDAYGKQLLAQYNTQTPTAELIERDDNYIEYGSNLGLYFSVYEDWSDTEHEAIKRAKDRILDVGCGAGRHALYLQEKGFNITGIDNSPGAIKVCKLRGLKKAFVRPIDEVDKFKPASFDTIMMMGNNFGLFGSRKNAKNILKKFALVTSPEAKIIAGTLDPYQTEYKYHLDYLKSNKRRGRMAGQIRMRIRFEKIVGEWFDYLFVSPVEMQDILSDTDWQVEEFIKSDEAHYFAVIGKKSS